MKLLIISNMAHYYRNGRIVGWGPTVEEINHLATLFDSVRHLGCLHDTAAPDSAMPYTANNVTLVPLPPTGGETIAEKWQIIKTSPIYIRHIIAELKQCDVVHLRCPANIPLLALIILMFTKKPEIRWAKFAGNWGAGKEYPASYRFQRWLLQVGITKCVVTINGTWPNQKPFIYTFNNPCLTNNEIEQASTKAMNKEISAPYRLLFVGALNPRKGVDRLLEIARLLDEEDIPYTMDIIGDGPDRLKYEAWCRSNELSQKVFFHGWLPKPQISNYYARAHINILPSESEGWPKVLSEGMAHGVVPIAGAVGSIPEILNETGAGIPIKPYGDITAYVEAIKTITQDQKSWKRYSRASIKTARDFTYEQYLFAVKSLFYKYI